ncbi:MAG: NADH-quinone oxidoreductase subunit J [Actinomycetota bacterium]|nr:NADH-quinone oxidoreductase subunit J [Actinomycetota bacterium]MDQ3575430.1 NADH-quinone oxidoreductase subunit J [Actinomycetota bacterium]
MTAALSASALILAAATKIDAGVFAACAVIVLAGAIGVVVSRNPVHAALFLVLTLFGVAVLFVAQEAHFLAAVQVIVYAGAIVVLFLFVIMLLGVDREENVMAEPLRAQRPIALLLGVISLAEIFLLAQGTKWATGAGSVAGPAGGPGSNVEKLARIIFTRYLLAFEVTSVLLVIAVVGAVVLARRSDAAPTASPAAARSEEALSPASEAPLSGASDEPLSEQAQPDESPPDESQPDESQPASSGAGSP